MNKVRFHLHSVRYMSYIMCPFPLNQERVQNLRTFRFRLGHPYAVYHRLRWICSSFPIPLQNSGSILRLRQRCRTYTKSILDTFLLNLLGPTAALLQ
jgi:hypothetical protein